MTGFLYQNFFHIIQYMRFIKCDIYTQYILENYNKIQLSSKEMAIDKINS